MGNDKLGRNRERSKTLPHGGKSGKISVTKIRAGVKRRFCAFFSVLMMLLTVVPAMSVSALSTDDVISPSALLMDASSGKILFEKNPHEIRACASITKVMTLLLVMEALDEGKISLDDVVTASAHAASMGGSDIWLEEGEQMTVDEMIKATAVASANDAAVALAEFICGSEDDFVALMNEKAKELGMEDTTFKNCNGLDEDGHLTSAYDVALMSRELITHPKIFDYTSIWMDTLRGGETQIVNTNKLLKSYDGITGLKTGTTGDAGSCITATAERGGLSLIAVILGADTGTNRFKDAAALLDWGFANFETLSLTLTDALYPVKVENGMADEVPVECPGMTAVTVSKGKGDSVKQAVNIAESLEAPVEKGTTVGTLSFMLDGEEVASFDIVTTESVEKMRFSTVFSVLLSSLVTL